MTDLRITSPCAAEWNSMSRVAGGRHCSICAKTVVDLTCLAPDERETELARIASLVQAGKRVCIRTPATRDGRVLSATRRILTGGMAAMLAVTVAGCQGSGAEQTTQQPATQQPTVETQVVPVMKGEADESQHPLGEVNVGHVVMGIAAIEPPKQIEPGAPHAAQ